MASPPPETRRTTWSTSSCPRASTGSGWCADTPSRRCLLAAIGGFFLGRQRGPAILGAPVGLRGGSEVSRNVNRGPSGKRSCSAGPTSRRRQIRGARRDRLPPSTCAPSSTSPTSTSDRRTCRASRRGCSSWSSAAGPTSSSSRATSRSAPARSSSRQARRFVDRMPVPTPRRPRQPRRAALPGLGARLRPLPRLPRALQRASSSRSTATTSC